MAFAKIKVLLRKAAARTLDHLWDAIRRAIDAISSTDAANFFIASGYEPD